MTIDIDATYRDGAIHPETPLNLPENTPVRIRVVPRPAPFPPIPFPTTREEVLAIRPKSPKITPEEFRARIAKYAVKVARYRWISRARIFIATTIDLPDHVRIF